MEHHAVLHAAQQFVSTAHESSGIRPQLHYVLPDASGRIRAEDLVAVLERCPRGGPGLVTLAHTNNEIGTVIDIVRIAAVIREANTVRPDSDHVFFHSDAVQSPGHGQVDVDAFGVDFLTLSAHKFHGPGGIGLLYVRDPSSLRPLLCGGHQQQGLRPGSEDVAACIAMTNAFVDANHPQKIKLRVRQYRAMSNAVWDYLAPYILSGLVLPTGPCDPRERAPHHISFCVRGAHRKQLVERFERDGGVLVSGGSACNAESDLPSHVLVSLGIPVEYIHGSVRITFSHTISMTQVMDVLIPALDAVLSPLS